MPMNQIMVPIDEARLSKLRHRLYGRGFQKKVDLDNSIAAHRLIHGRFAPSFVPQPFAVVQESIGHVLHAYTDRSINDLQQSPVVNESWDGVDPFDWAAARERAIPQFKPMDYFIFRLICAPTVRGHDASGKTVESDAFLAARKKDPAIRKEDAYEQWVAKKLVEQGPGPARVAARLVPGTFQIIGESQKMAMRPLYEKGGKRSRSHSYGRMRKIMCAGSLEVVDGEAFCGILCKGIGRSRAYGMGMMQLVRAQ